MSFGAADLIIKRGVINPKGGPAVGGTTDPASGLEFIEIQNVGDASIDLGANHVALVNIDNERDNGAQLDGYWTLSGTLAAGASLIIQDQTGTSGAGSTVTLTSPNGTSYTHTVRSTQWFPDTTSVRHPEWELANSGGNFMLVGGFDTAMADDILADSLNQQKMDFDDNLVLDWAEDGDSNTNLWTTQYDAVVIWPEDETLGDYTGAFTWPHKIVSTSTTGSSNGSFTADYFMRVYRLSGTTKIYDDAIISDLANFVAGSGTTGTLPMDGNLNSTSTLEFRSFSGASRASGTLLFKNSSNTTLTGSITGYVLYGQGGNWTNNTSYDHVTINGVNYFH